jgi:hypothetical protein
MNEAVGSLLAKNRSIQPCPETRTLIKDKPIIGVAIIYLAAITHHARTLSTWEMSLLPPQNPEAA